MRPPKSDVAVMPHSTAPLQTRLGSDDTAILKGFLPTKHHTRKKLSSGKLDEEICNDRLPDQLRYVYDRSEPAVFVVD